jgi:hypothetical protein
LIDYLVQLEKEWNIIFVGEGAGTL